MRAPRIITAPTIEPVSWAEVQAQLRLDSDDEADKAMVFAISARQRFEHYTGRTLHQTLYEAAWDYWPQNGNALILPKAAPLIAVTWIKYYDSYGTENTWSSALYVVDDRSLPARVRPAYGEIWPSFTPYPVNPIVARYTSGIADASPQLYPEEGAKTAILLLTAALWENRESFVAEPGLTASVELPEGFRAFADQYRVEFAL